MKSNVEIKLSRRNTAKSEKEKGTTIYMSLKEKSDFEKYV